jgi:hypothetical protein
MRFAIGWILYGAPFVATVFAWVGLGSHWRTEGGRITKTLAVLLATASALWACGALAYVEFVKEPAPRDFRIEGRGLELSLLAIIAGLVTLRSPRWFSSLALAASAWMFVLFFLTGMTA